nr:hypothetical protein [Martelella endophytica]
MPWKESSVMEERLRFVARLLEGGGMSDVCRDFGISCKTGYKIFNRLMKACRAWNTPSTTATSSSRRAVVSAWREKKLNISTMLAGQRLGIKEVDDGIWLISFMRYDLGYIDLGQKTLQTIDNPFGTRLSPMS